MLEASAGVMELRDGRVKVKDVPEKYVTLQQIAADTMRFGTPYEPLFGRGRSANRVASPAFCAHWRKYAADPEPVSGLLDYVAAQDVGRAINPRQKLKVESTAVWCKVSAGRCLRKWFTMRVGKHCQRR